MKTAQEYADLVLKEIYEDMASGLVPWDVPDFSALHDSVDANMYIIDTMDADWDTAHPRATYTEEQIREAFHKATRIIEVGDESVSTVQKLLDVLDDDVQPHTRDDEEYTTLVDTVTDLVDRELRHPSWCRTCGNPVEHGKCGCWALLAQALQQYLGYGYDESADKAARMWDKKADKPYVWRNAYAYAEGGHFIKIGPDVITAVKAGLTEIPLPVYDKPEGKQ